MRKTVDIILLSLLFAVTLTGFALADVAAAPMYAIFIGVPLAIVAVAVIVIVLIVKAVKRKSSNRRRGDDK